MRMAWFEIRILKKSLNGLQECHAMASGIWGIFQKKNMPMYMLNICEVR